MHEYVCMYPSLFSPSLFVTHSLACLTQCLSLADKSGTNQEDKIYPVLMRPGMRLGSPLQTAADTKTRGWILPKLPRMETDTDDQ